MPSPKGHHLDDHNNWLSLSKLAFLFILDMLNFIEQLYWSAFIIILINMLSSCLLEQIQIFYNISSEVEKNGSFSELWP